MNLSAKDKLTKERINLIAKHPFFGTLALRLNLLEIDKQMEAWFHSNGLRPTMAVDGRNIFYSEDFVNTIGPKLLLSALAHEVMHCVLTHMTRQGSRIQMKWLRATDYAVNGTLKRSGFELHENWLYDPKYNEKWSAEMIYNDLPDDTEEEPQDYVMVASESEDPALNHEWEVAVQQAAFAARQAGKLPSDLERFVQELVAPKIDWRTQLRRFITETSKSDYSWQRPNKFLLPMGTIMPGLYSQHMNVLVPVIDDSGSIGPKILDAFAGEVGGARDSARPKRTVLISCDARVNHVDDLDEFAEFSPKLVRTHGGGGTDFRPPFEWIRNEGIRPSCLIYLTDGYGPFPEYPPDYPVMWCITTDVVPPWGEHLKITAD